MSLFSLKCIYIALISLFLAFTTKADVIVLANGEWPPFLSEKQPYGGFASHVVEVVFEQMGYGVLYKYYPWARAEYMVKHDHIQGSVVWSRSNERETFALFSEPVLTLQSVIFHLKSRPIEWQSLSDFKKKILCQPLGSATDFFQPLLDKRKLRLERVTDMQAGFRLLLKNRCDFMSLSKDVGNYVLRNQLSKPEIDKITYNPKPLKQMDYALMLSKKQKRNAGLLKEFNKHLRWLKDTGRLAKMRDAFERGDYDPQVTVDLY